MPQLQHNMWGGLPDCRSFRHGRVRIGDLVRMIPTPPHRLAGQDIEVSDSIGAERAHGFAR
jgi:hypothetical protein